MDTITLESDLLAPKVQSKPTRMAFMKALDWLLESDPAIRWQALRDLTDAPAAVVATERARVATEGWAARSTRSPGI